MARADVEKFLTDYSSNAGGLKTNYGNDKSKAVNGYKGAKLTKSEKEMLIRGSSHEIKDYLKDAYAAALSVDIP